MELRDDEIRKLKTQWKLKLLVFINNNIYILVFILLAVLLLAVLFNRSENEKHELKNKNEELKRANAKLQESWSNRLYRYYFGDM
jgi:flagellar biosynthesis/type III secretory pathway M-ring protein FliF/YscJ